MAKRRERKIKPIPLSIGNDPSLWRFGSLGEALQANTVLIADLIRSSQPVVSPAEAGIADRELDDMAAR
jgi:hypothetical protein